MFTSVCAGSESSTLSGIIYKIRKLSPRLKAYLVNFPQVPLESRTDDNVLTLTNKVFKLLKKYGGGTDGKGENHDLGTMLKYLGGGGWEGEKEKTSFYKNYLRYNYFGST